MNDPNEFPSYNQPLETNYAAGQYSPDAFAHSGQTPVPTGPPPVLAW